MTKTRKSTRTRTYEGLPVVDAPEQAAIVFTVNKSDVAHSRPNDPGNCAAALAIKRDFKTDVRVHLTKTYVKSPDGKKWFRFQTPESVSREIVSFDRAKTFEPGEYYVRPVSESARLGVHHGKSYHGNGARKASRPHKFTANVRSRFLGDDAKTQKKGK